MMFFLEAILLMEEPTFNLFWEKLNGEDGVFAFGLLSLITEELSGIIILELSSVISNGGSLICFLLVTLDKFLFYESSFGAGRTFSDRIFLNDTCFLILKP